MNEILVVTLIILQIIVGYTVCRLLIKTHELSLFSFFPISFSLGVGFTSYLLFLFSIIKVPWNPLIILFVIVLFLFVNKNAFKVIRLPRINYWNLTFIQRSLLFLNFIVVIYTCIQVLLRPLYAWDGWAIWLLKSRSFFYDGFLNPEIYHIVKDSYPFVMSLNSTFYYNFLGQPDDKAVLISYFLFYFMTGMMIFSALYRKVGVSGAFLSAFLFFSLQNTIRHGGRFEAGYSDMALGFYIFIAIVLFQEVRRLRSSQPFLLLGLIVGIVSLIKQEGAVASLIISICVLWSIIKDSRKVSKMMFYLAGFIPFFAWIVFKKNNGISYSLYDNYEIVLSRFNEIITEILKEFLSVQNWNLLWFLFILLLPVLLVSKKIRYEIVIIFSILVVYIIVFLGGPHDPAIHIPNTINRLLLHIVPLVIYSISIAINEYYKKIKK